MLHAKQHNTKSPSHGDAGQKAITRKSFLSSFGAFAWLGSISLAMMGSLRAAIPSVLPDPSLKFRIGQLADFSVGSTRTFEEENVAIFRDEEGIFAISTQCTHLGCIVRRDEQGFLCPCHGSRYSLDGSVTQGPAPKPLLWYAIKQTPGGLLLVDRAKTVAVGTKFDFTGTLA